MSTPFLVVFSPLHDGSLFAVIYQSLPLLLGLFHWHYPLSFLLELPLAFAVSGIGFFLFLPATSASLNITHVLSPSLLSLLIPLMINTLYANSRLAILALAFFKAARAADLFDVFTATHPIEKNCVSMMCLRI